MVGDTITGDRDSSSANKLKRAPWWGRSAEASGLLKCKLGVLWGLRQASKPYPAPVLDRGPFKLSVLLGYAVLILGGRPFTHRWLRLGLG